MREKGGQRQVVESKKAQWYEENRKRGQAKNDTKKK